ncbi:Vitamin B12 transporter BtuB [Campylobacter majalis]|uniref:Vitamin B12 transporter BtuB n=1 Tax=Campylobacter majalis TaxID=2790656 RepID=A0ABN7KB04_9BACT|nr:TonB-dependent receptor [Campylobacter majalis]CAD7289640.1 Vitamin B12 transporter BtuB [Campylobacter majalis]
MYKQTLILSAILYASCLSANQTQDIKLDQIIISTSGFSQNADENLRNITIITSDELQNKGYTSLTDALKRIASVSFVNSGLGDNIDMRGQGAKANVAVKVLLDDRVINVLDNAHGVTPINSINIDNIERIEIIAGGGAVLYGNGTRGGVINIITKRKTTDSAYLGTKLHTFESQNSLGSNFNLGFSKQLNENFSFGTDVDVFNKNRFRDGEKSKGVYLSNKLNLDIGDDTKAGISYNFYSTTDHETGNVSKNKITKDNKAKGDDEIISKTTRPEISLNLQHTFTDEFKASANIYYQNQNIKFKRNKSPMNARGMTTIVDGDGSGFKDTKTGVNLKGKYDYGNKSYTILGYEFIKHKANRYRVMSYDIPRVISHKMITDIDMTKTSNSVFLLNSHQFNKNFNLSGGIRYEQAKYDTSRDYLSSMTTMMPPPAPKTTKTHQIYNANRTTNNYVIDITPSFAYSNSGRVYFKYERGFISPSPAQLTNKSQTHGYYTANLNAEIFDTLEVGLKDNILNLSDIKLSIYHTKTKDEIAYVGNPHARGGGYWTYYNIDQTRRIGVELELSQAINSRLSLYQNLSYIDAKITKGVNDGKRIPYVSKIKTNIGINYEIMPDLNVFANAVYLSKSLDGGSVESNTGKMQNNQYMKGHFLTDISLSYTHKNFEFNTGVKNVFNKEYYSYQNANNDSYLPAQGRSYYAEFKYKF